MKVRHAAALALVGWYLMVPPVGQDPGALGKWVPEIWNPPPARWSPVLDAPFGQWENKGSFDLAKDCAEAKKKLEQSRVAESAQADKAIPAGVERECEVFTPDSDAKSESIRVEGCPDDAHISRATIVARRTDAGVLAAYDAECIATDDPRLKEK